MAEIVIVHSSDIHVDEGRTAAAHRGDGAAGLAAVLRTARRLGADLVLLAGDIFESNQVSTAVVDRACRLLAEACTSVVVLPGNHDPLLPESVFRRGFAELPNLAILGLTHDEAVRFDVLDLEIWGHAHRDYGDMRPLRGPRPRTTRHQIAVAHGHYEPPENLATPLRPSWIFSDDDIAATAADYLALGHWDRAVRVGNGVVPAFYSGSPDLAGTVNLVRLGAGGEARVSREPLLWEE